jgi:hypothetical protein
MEDGENGREMKKREERSYKLSQIIIFYSSIKTTILFKSLLAKVDTPIPR